MDQLRVVGSEDGTLVLATEAGHRFVLPIDEVVRAELRRTRRDPEPRTVKPSPREIQAHVRAGLTAPQVADLLGIRIEDVVRYEGPVLAEREHVVDQALAVPVLLGGEFDAEETPTFGSAVRAKLADAHATGERWSSWKDDSGWNVKLEFVASEVDHDARWSFDPRRSTLAPLNTDATQLSRQGTLPEGLIPRLRALDVPPPKDDTRFDSGAFGPRHGDHEGGFVSAAPTAAQDAAIKRAPEDSPASAETADLLEALRRRRGQREPQPQPVERDDSPPAHAPVALFDALEPGYDGGSADDIGDEVDDITRISADSARRKGRSAMPSWDEIVFGARTDD